MAFLFVFSGGRFAFSGERLEKRSEKRSDNGPIFGNGENLRKGILFGYVLYGQDENKVMGGS